MIEGQIVPFPDPYPLWSEASTTYRDNFGMAKAAQQAPLPGPESAPHGTPGCVHGRTYQDRSPPKTLNSPSPASLGEKKAPQAPRSCEKKKGVKRAARPRSGAKKKLGPWADLPLADAAAVLMLAPQHVP